MSDSGQVPDFAIELNRIFTPTYFSKETKLDVTCRLACKTFQAASVSIFAYKGLHDKLVCIGRYIDPAIAQLDFGNQPEIKDIFEYMSACEFLYENDIGREIDEDIVYRSYDETVVKPKRITKVELRRLAEGFPDWKETYRTVKEVLKREAFTVGEGSVTGRYFAELLKRGNKFIADNRVQHLDDIADSQQTCIFTIEQEINIRFKARKLYVALPLFANGRYFGILRAIFPNRKSILDELWHQKLKQEKQNRHSVLRGKTRTILQNIAQIISLQLELDYFLDGYKNTYLTSIHEIGIGAQRSDRPQPEIKRYLDRQCQDISEIIECKGALVKQFDAKSQQYHITGSSENLALYARWASIYQQRFSQDLLDMGRKEGMLAAHMSCLDFDGQVVTYTAHKDSGNLKNELRKWDLPDFNSEPFRSKLERFNIANVAILPIPNLYNAFMLFFNTANRCFLDKDIEMIHRAVKKIGLELASVEETQRIKNRQEVIDRMHAAINQSIFEQDSAEDHVRAFLEILSDAIDELDVFTHHYTWQYVTEFTPGEKGADESQIFRNITRKNQSTNPFSDNFIECSKRNYYHTLTEDEKNRMPGLLDEHARLALDPFFGFQLRQEYQSFDLPFFSNDDNHAEGKLIGVITCVFRKTEKTQIFNANFINFMNFFASQIGLAWKELRRVIIAKIQERIDREIGQQMRPQHHADSERTELTGISTILAEEFGCDFCCFFLMREHDSSLALEASNLPVRRKITYDLKKDAHLLSVKSYKKNKNFRLFGRRSVEKQVDVQRLNDLERELKSDVLTEIWEKTGRYHSDICVEHWLSVVIHIGKDHLGLVKLFRLKGIANYSDEKERWSIRNAPFSEFETSILNRISKHIYNVLKRHSLNEKAFQTRLEDMRSVVHQVVAPLAALSQHCSNIQAGRIPEQKIPEKLAYIGILSRQSARQARNFQRILDLETGKTELSKSRIRNLWQFLIGVAIDFQPLAQNKNITIHVKADDFQDPDLFIHADEELLKHVIANLFDNAVKYSFTPRQREKLGLPTKPPENDHPTNILVEIEDAGDEVIISIRNLGLPIKPEEREHIFEREYRGEIAKTLVLNGSGIGLFLAREIVLRHDGELNLVPSDNANLSIFEIKLPKG